MFGVKVIALLALAFVASATDLEEGLAIMACAKRAIKGGVPELGIPSHDPYVEIKHEFSWSGNFLDLFGAEINMHDMTWAGLATWELTASQISKDSDARAVFDFKIYWKHMTLAGKYDALEREIAFNTEQHGNFFVNFEESTWTGKIDLTKPNAFNNGTVNDVKIDWDVKNVNVIITGLELFDIPASLGLSNLFKNALNNHLIGNTVGDFMKMRLSTIWWNTGKVWDLVQWCNDHPSV